MNKKVHELIEAEKERLESTKKTLRDKHLINLGLIDEVKTAREYKDAYSENYPYYDSEVNKHYRETKVALGVTDQEYEEICRFFPTKAEKVDDSNTYENTLNTIGNITLIVGLICTLILFFSIVFIDAPYGDSEFNSAGFAITLSVLLTTITTWALLRVISSISINVRQLNNKAR
jgi:hypothetical protein